MPKRVDWRRREARKHIPVYEPGGRRYPLRLGQKLHHGTTSMFVFKRLHKVAFVSPNKEEARSFTYGSVGPFGGSPPRVLTYRLKRLPVLLNKDYPKNDNYPLSKRVGARGFRENVKLSYLFCNKRRQLGLDVDGWRAHWPNEIMLCDPMKFLEYESTERLSHKPTHRPSADGDTLWVRRRVYIDGKPTHRVVPIDRPLGWWKRWWQKRVQKKAG